MFVPVVNQKQEPLMSTTPARARKWVKSGKATPFWKKGVFCVRLNVEPSDNKKQEIAVGIDPGSKREAYTVKSEAHTFLNVLSETPNWVKDAVKARREMRRGRRYRNTPCRQNRQNKAKGGLPPSTKARWQLKLKVSKWLMNMFPVTCFVVEDIKAKTKGQKRWDKSFSPLEVGKNWFYSEMRKLCELETHTGYETKALRDELGLHKSKSKLSDKFDAHNVDSWVLAYYVVGSKTDQVDNKGILKIVPLRFHRRQLHAFQFSKGGKRKLYGGTRSMGFKRGSIVEHPKYSVCYIGGTSKGRISLHSTETGERLCQNVKPQDCGFRTYTSWRAAFLPVLKQ